LLIPELYLSIRQLEILTKQLKKMEITLTLEQISYIKSLDSSRKQKEFLLTAIIENITSLGESVKISKLPSQKYIFTPNGLVPMSKEFSDLIDSEGTFPWYSNSLKDVEEKFNKMVSKISDLPILKISTRKKIC